MAVCIYDNPNTWRREYWDDGELRQSVCGIALMSKLWPYKTRKFDPGYIEGDPSAMKAERAQGVGNEK